MKKILNTCRDTGHLFGVYLRDILPLNHEVFLFKKLMGQIDTTAFWSSYYKAGGSIYNQEYMLDILLYAYCNGIYSSRKLAKATRENVAFIYLSGNTPISYRAICNFINKYQDSLAHVFIEFVRIALESGYLNKQLPFSLDGTKLKANASNKHTFTKSEWKSKHKKLRAEIIEFFNSINDEEGILDVDNEETRIKQVEDYLNKKSSTSDKKNSATISSMKKKVTSFKKASKVLEKNEDVADKTYLNSTDPNSRLMKNHGKIEESYNAQITSNNQFITTVDVTNEENDQNQL